MAEIVLNKNVTESIELTESSRIVCEKGVQASLIVLLEQKMDVDLSMEIKENAALTVFFRNASEDLTVREKTKVAENGSVRIAYCELEGKKLWRTSFCALEGRNARASYISGSLVEDDKHMEIVCDHLCGDSESHMETYAVMVNDSSYYVCANGRIENGSHRSVTHQTSRVLTFADRQRANIIPKLEIEDNDVEASHATSIGQLDENQLYYLMSRGIQKEEALRLIALGYLMPLSNVTEDEELRQYLKELIEKKVSEACLM